jgi:hypothetical protein
MADFRVENIDKDLAQMSANIEAIDMDSVKKKTAKRIAEEMSKMVRQAVFESGIKSPADKISKYSGGDGPPMVTNAAWLVRQTGPNRYSVFPHPEVRQRAIVLNYGYPGRITPNSADALRFEVNGTPVFAESVEGPDAYNYWDKAWRRIQKSKKIDDILGEELEAEFEEKF